MMKKLVVAVIGLGVVSICLLLLNVIQIHLLTPDEPAPVQFGWECKDRMKATNVGEIMERVFWLDFNGELKCWHSSKYEFIYYRQLDKRDVGSWDFWDEK